MFGKMLENVRATCPLVHNITNYVTVNDVANCLLAVGGSPIMADDFDEVDEITSICSGLNINIGTLNSRSIQSMLKAGLTAKQMGIPCVLDPVGAGASKLRTSTALKLIDDIPFVCIKGNISEILTLQSSGIGHTDGVDASPKDAINEDNLDSTLEIIKAYARKTNAIIACTGKIDIVTDGKKTYLINNGHEMMSKVSGTGCMLSACICAFVTANRDCPLEAVAAAVVAMGLCGEIAVSRLEKGDGNMTLKHKIIDAVFNLDSETLESGAKYVKR